MKSLGKHDVQFRAYINGKFSSEYTERRTVYHNATGDLFINDMDTKRQIEKEGALFVAVFNIKSLTPTTVAQILAGRA